MGKEQAEKLLHALETIKEECSCHETCGGCPMQSISSMACMLRNSEPDRWILNYVLPGTWKAFK